MADGHLSFVLFLYNYESKRPIFVANLEWVVGNLELSDKLLLIIFFHFCPFYLYILKFSVFRHQLR